jgi:hypothetical protein
MVTLLVIGKHYTSFRCVAPPRLWAVVVDDGFERCASTPIRYCLATKGRYTYCSVYS